MPETTKLPLPYEALRDVIDLSLWTGQLLLQHGADSRRIEQTVHLLGTSLGCDWLDVLVSPNAIVVTANSGGEFRTKVRRVVRTGVNMNMLAEINAISRQVVAGDLDRHQTRVALERLDTLRPIYNRWLIVGMVGLACAAFSQLFGGDWPAFLATWAAASAAMFTRQELARRHFNHLLITLVTAFVAGVIASSAILLEVGEEPQLVLASSVLLLVPGVPLINSAQDLIEGHVVMGLVRGLMGGLISMAIALGLLLAMSLMGVEGL